MPAGDALDRINLSNISTFREDSFMKRFSGAVFAFALLFIFISTFAFAEQASTEIKLPDPVTDGDVSLEKTISARGSVRIYKNKPLKPEDLGQLLWAGQGQLSKRGRRTAPSAGARYPMTLYVVQKTGLWKYLPKTHSLLKIHHENIKGKLAMASLGQSPVTSAPSVILVVANVNITARKYKKRAVRYCDLEAGHIAQNIALQAVARKIGMVTIGAFNDDKIRALLDLPEHFRICYVLPVGYI